MILCRFAAALVSADEALISAIVKHAIDAGIPVRELREVILTAYLFDGYPTALEGFRIMAEIGLKPDVEPNEFAYSISNIVLWRQRGEPLCRRIYGSQYDPLRIRVNQIAPELADAMIVEGYGKVLARDELDVRVRELCVVSILAAKYKPRQLLSHALGALRLGATPGQLRKVIGIVAEYAPNINIKGAGHIIEEAIMKYELP